MPRDFLKGAKDSYDVVVIGSGLAGLTSANLLARQGYSVLLLEHHYQLGGMATWFKRAGGHIFDISLHGFPYGMIKSCRKYWTQGIAESIVQLNGIRFENPQFSLRTTFTREDFTRIIVERFGISIETVKQFFDTARGMNFFDEQKKTTRELFEQFFPGRDDVVRPLMEPITYANGSTLEDPAITYGIVFSNFMQKGVYTFEGGTDALVNKMRAELIRNGVDIRIRSLVEKIVVSRDRKITGVVVNGKRIGCRTIVSNANIKSTILKLVGEEHFDRAPRGEVPVPRETQVLARADADDRGAVAVSVLDRSSVAKVDARFGTEPAVHEHRVAERREAERYAHVAHIAPRGGDALQAHGSEAPAPSSSMGRQPGRDHADPKSGDDDETEAQH